LHAAARKGKLCEKKNEPARRLMAARSGTGATGLYPPEARHPPPRAGQTKSAPPRHRDWDAVRSL